MHNLKNTTRCPCAGSSRHGMRCRSPVAAVQQAAAAGPAAGGSRCGRGAAAVLALTLEYAAQLRGVREVEVRARVSGILLEAPVPGRRARQGRTTCCSGSTPLRSARRWRARARSSACSRRICSRRAASAIASCRCTTRSSRACAIATPRIAAFESAHGRGRRRAGGAAHAPSSIFRTRMCARRSAGLTSREVRSEGSLVTAGGDSSLLTLYRSGGSAVRRVLACPKPRRERSCARRTMAASAGKVAVRVTDAQGTTLGDNARDRVHLAARRRRDGHGRRARGARQHERTLLPGQVVRARIEGVSARGLARDSEARRHARRAGRVRLGHRRRATRSRRAPCSSARRRATTSR